MSAFFRDFALGSVMSASRFERSVWLAKLPNATLARPARAHKKMYYIFGILP